MALSDCNGRQLKASGHITTRKNTRLRGSLWGSDRWAVVGSGRHSYRVEPERSDVRRAAHREHKRIGHKMISVAEFQGDAAVDVPLGAHQRRAEEELDPARPVDVDEFRRQLGIIAAQDRVRTVQEGHLAAKTVEDAGELDRDIAASNDPDAARQGFEFEYLV